jgi:serine/threonine protein kinase
MISKLGRYEIIEELGRGVLGVVYKAKDPIIDRNVALKAINLQDMKLDEKRAYLAQFYQQARAFKRLSHPNIASIYDMGESDGMAYFTMELLEGNALHHLLKDAQRMPVEKALNIIIQVATGLDYAHERGIAHRDIKPSNIMVLKDNQIKIIDFGIASMAASLLKMQSDQAIRSPWYIAPEKVLNQSVDCRLDIFSVGAILFQMLTGRPPFLAGNAHSVMYQIVNENPQKTSSLNPLVPNKLDFIVAKCLAKNPDARYQNANELTNDLRICREMPRAKAIFDRRQSQVGAYWRKTQAGSLLRRKLSLVEIMCITLLVSVTLLLNK